VLALQYKVAAVFLLPWLTLPGQTGGRTASVSQLGALSGSFRELSRKVSPSVVKVVTVGYRQLEEDESEEPGVAVRQQSSGSGVIIDPEGYIVTNAHVVVGAQRVQVTLPATVPGGPGSPRRTAARTVRGEVVGLDMESDVALLKIGEKGLPALPLADSDEVGQGQIVLAFGSPLGLDNTVTMGIVSSTARQFKLDDPMVYIQTDAPINPGNSGGPLVDTQGNVVGINTLILSQSGGSEGIGFAVPSNIVASVVGQLRKTGKVLRGDIGVLAQTITPPLAEAWKLPRDWGVVLGDVDPDGPAEEAGLKAGDVIHSLNGKVMENARQFNVSVYRPASGGRIRLEVLRGDRTLSVSVEVKERNLAAADYSELASREENLIPELGIFAVDLTPELRALVSPVRRNTGGILVASKSAEGPLIEDGFQAGDVIYAVNRSEMAAVADLRVLLKKMKPGSPVAVQVERAGKLRFISFELP
jgi:serine protease Do